MSSLLVAGDAAALSTVPDAVDHSADVAEDLDETPGYADPKDSAREWALSIGLSGRLGPDYEGSNDYEFDVGPILSGSWRNTIFFKGKTLGANLIRGENIKAGPILSWTSGRDENDNDKLEGLGDVDDSIEAGGFVSYRKEPWRLKGEIRQDINSGHDGALVELIGGYTLPFETLPVVVELGTTLASDNYMESFFGVDAQQSADSGLKRYDADAGIKDVKIRMNFGYSITNRWRIGSILEYKRLVGDAADSPIVDDKNQFTAGVGLSYHLGSKILPEELK
jgi:outer membrane scaffolding protein for murein synthesis (MipA/OmpV family)